MYQMSYELHTDLDTLSDRLTTGMKDALQRAIRARLEIHANEILDQVSADMAKSLHGIIRSCRQYSGNTLQVQLILDGVDKTAALLKDTK